MFPVRPAPIPERAFSLKRSIVSRDEPQSSQLSYSSFASFVPQPDSSRNPIIRINYAVRIHAIRRRVCPTLSQTLRGTRKCHCLQQMRLEKIPLLGKCLQKNKTPPLSTRPQTVHSLSTGCPLPRVDTQTTHFGRLTPCVHPFLQNFAKNSSRTGPPGENPDFQRSISLRNLPQNCRNSKTCSQ
jgi:hypothetical protein